MNALPPLQKTREQIASDLLEAMKGILGSNVTLDALKKPSRMTLDDILMNIHLYERLGSAFVAVGALRNYTGTPRGYSVIE